MFTGILSLHESRNQKKNEIQNFQQKVVWISPIFISNRDWTVNLTNLNDLSNPCCGTYRPRKSNQINRALFGSRGQGTLFGVYWSFLPFTPTHRHSTWRDDGGIVVIVNVKWCNAEASSVCAPLALCVWVSDSASRATGGFTYTLTVGVGEERRGGERERGGGRLLVG